MPTHTDHRDALLQRGRDFMRLRREFVADHDCLSSMIMACIDDGLVTRDDIVRTVPKFVGHGYAHVAVALDEITGPDPSTDYLFRDTDKTYRLHPASTPKRRRAPRTQRA